MMFGYLHSSQSQLDVSVLKALQICEEKGKKFIILILTLRQMGSKAVGLFRIILTKRIYYK